MVKQKKKKTAGPDGFFKIPVLVILLILVILIVVVG